MSPSSDMPTQSNGSLPLEIAAADASTEIFVLDGDLQMLGRGVGNLRMTLPPGIYKVKSRAGDETREQHVVLMDSGQRIELPPFAFVSPAPLAGTAAWQDEHAQTAAHYSTFVNFSKGSGSHLFVFAREFSRAVRDSARPLLNPAEGLSICSTDGTAIYDLAAPPAMGSAGVESWAALNIGLDPGVYVLRAKCPDGSRFDQVVTTSPGWQTQVFVLPRN